jgi:HAD superfamily hydrolase (TIGR01450 family)
VQLYDAYVFDLDGTVVLGEALLPTVAETIGKLRALRRRTLFLTNNPTSAPADYSRTLTALGITTPAEDIVTSALVLVDHLRRTMPAARLMVIGEAALIRALEEGGFEIVTDPRRTDVLVASFDRTFDYAKLQGAFDAVRAGARFFATNGDRYRPTPEGGQPDAAAVIAAIEACSGKRCEQIVGKPSALTSRFLLDRLELPPDRCLLVGDRLETDVAMALQAGMAAALVLTGATTRAEAAASSIVPTYVLDRLIDLLPQPSPHNRRHPERSEA